MNLFIVNSDIVEMLIGFFSIILFQVVGDFVSLNCLIKRLIRPLLPLLPSPFDDCTHVLNNK